MKLIQAHFLSNESEETGITVDMDFLYDTADYHELTSIIWGPGATNKLMKIL